MRFDKFDAARLWAMRKELAANKQAGLYVSERQSRLSLPGLGGSGVVY